MDKPNLLFYSNTNKKCIELLKFMKSKNIDKNFKIVCVDNNNSNTVKKITTIPTMIIPSLNKVFTGNEVYLFIVSITRNEEREKREEREDKREEKRDDNKRDNETNKTIDKETKVKTKDDNNETIETNNTNNSNNEVLGYVIDEMSGLSDKYSYINIDISPIHNYGYF